MIMIWPALRHNQSLCGLRTSIDCNESPYSVNSRSESRLSFESIPTSTGNDHQKQTQHITHIVRTMFKYVGGGGAEGAWLTDGGGQLHLNEGFTGRWAVSGSTVTPGVTLCHHCAGNTWSVSAHVVSDIRVCDIKLFISPVMKAHNNTSIITITVRYNHMFMMPLQSCVKKQLINVQLRFSSTISSLLIALKIVVKK